MMESLRSKYEANQARMKAIQDEAHATKRDLTHEERTETGRLLKECADWYPKVKAADESSALLAKIAALPEFRAHGEQLTAAGGLHMPGSGAGWKSVADQLHETGKAACGLKELVITEPSQATTTIIPGIDAMPLDQRYLYPLWPQTPTDGSVLAVTDYRITARGADEASTPVERDPLDVTTDKATRNVSVDAFSAPMRQVACIMDGVPAALIEALPGLVQLLTSELQIALNAAIDAHLLAAIASAAPPSGVTAGSTEARVREGVNKMAAFGFLPNIVAIHPDDAAAVDQHTMLDAVKAWPYSLRVVTTPDVDAGAPLLLDTTRCGVIYLGGASILLDPYAGVGGVNFKRNLVDVRLESDVLAIVRQPNAMFVCSPSS